MCQTQRWELLKVLLTVAILQQQPSMTIMQLYILSSNYSYPYPSSIDPVKAVSFFRSQRGLLLNLIRHCLFTLADRLYSEFLIPQEAYDEVCNQSLNKTQRGGVLLDCIEARLQAVPADLMKVVGIFKSEPFLESTAKELVQNYCKLLYIQLQLQLLACSQLHKTVAEQLVHAVGLVFTGPLFRSIIAIVCGQTTFCTTSTKLDHSIFCSSKMCGLTVSHNKFTFHNN